jgi:hypothetical protein
MLRHAQVVQNKVPVARARVSADFLGQFGMHLHRMTKVRYIRFVFRDYFKLLHLQHFLPSI